MTKTENIVKKNNSNDGIGKFFVLNRKKPIFIQGWMTIEKTIKQFAKDLIEEIEYEWDSEKTFIEKYNLFYIDINNSQLKEIRDDKTLNAIRRNDKIFIVLLDKGIKLPKIEDIPMLDKWYRENLAKYDS